MDKEKDLSILIPTMNRSDFLMRLLNYYADNNYKYQILIGDSSNAKHIEITKKAIEQFKGKLRITYREYPGINVAECLRQLTKLVTTPYAVFIADDDFLVPDGLEQCMKFLDDHGDYIAAHGMGISIRLRSNGSYGKFLGCTKYRLPVIEEDTASKRLLNHLKDYSVTLFCVHRTEAWRTMCQEDVGLVDTAFRAELLPCCLSVIQGKVKQLNCFYLVRQDHNRRYLLPNIDDWVRDPTWEHEYKIFRDYLAEELVRQEGITIDVAVPIVEKAFKLYLNNARNNKFKKIQTALSYIIGLRYLLRMLRYIWLNRSGDFSLPMLLSPSSPYYKDFLPVYKVITEK